MSQFILFTSKECKSEFSDLKDSSFLQKCAKSLFKRLDIHNIYTLAQFDELCMEAQNEMFEGKSIIETKLFAYIELLKDEEIFFWYGSEFDDLDKIKDFDKLIESIYQSLTEASGEIYIHYKSNITNFIF